MVDRRDYFCINRGRQYGKTTTLRFLKKALESEYTVFSISFEGADDSFLTLNSLENYFFQLLWKAQPKDISSKAKSLLKRYTGNALFNIKPEETYGLECDCLPSTSPANAVWSLERLIEVYGAVKA